MKKTTVTNIIALAIMLLLSSRFLIAGWNRILFNSNSAEGDQAAYLQLGLDVQERGQLTDGKRNPLYPVILATFAEREWHYFTWAKILNLGVGLITIWAVYLVGRSIFNQATGVLAAFLLSINIEFILHSTFALAESFLILLFLLAWFTMVRALQDPGQLRYWIAAGGLTGLAYLAKGTGPLLLICFIVTATLLYRHHIWQRRSFWSFVASCCLVASPLWLYNWLNFGSPLFNSAINNVMWMDSATEKYVVDPSAMPTLLTYVQEKSVADAWYRLWDGLLTMRYFFVRLLWPTRTLTFDHWFQAGRIDLILVLLVVLTVLAWRVSIQVIKHYRESLLLTGVLVLVFYVLFGWYIAISPFPIRFILPLASILYLLLSAAVIALVRSLLTTPKIPRWSNVVIGVGILLITLQPLGWFAVTGWLIAKDSQRSAFAADAEFNEYIDQALLWTQTGHQNSEDPVTVMWGPTHMLPIWKHTDRLNLLRTPVAQARSVDDLGIFMEANNVAYVVIDEQMVDRMGSDNAAEWGVHKAEDARLAISDYPLDWALGFVGPQMPCQWCVFRRLSATPVIEAADYNLGQSIHLFGYQIQDKDFRPGGQVVVTLYWKSIQPVSVDYTVFTQLLGPDFQLHGQMDRQPLSGHWPTSRWLPGQKFVDKFVLKVDEATPPGEYVILVGLYDTNDGQRLPITTNSGRVPDDAIRLVFLTLPANESLR